MPRQDAALPLRGPRRRQHVGARGLCRREASGEDRGGRGVPAGRAQRRVGAWKHWFTAEDAAFFDGLFADFYATFGYRPEAPHAEQRIERANTIDYTIRLINERRARPGRPLFDPTPPPLTTTVPEAVAATKRSLYRAVRARMSALLSGALR